MSGKRRIIVQSLVAIALVACSILGTLTYQNLLGGNTSPQKKEQSATKALTTQNWADNWKVNPDTGTTTNGSSNLKSATVHSDDSDEVKFRKETFNNDFVGNPALDCSDRRNAGLTWNQTKDIVPCINGSIHLRLTDGELSVISSTDSSVMTHKATVGDPKSDRHFDTSNWDITLRKDTREVATSEMTSIDEPFYLIGYDYKNTYRAFEFYVKNGDKPWVPQVNLNDQSWSADATVDFVLTWQDPTKPMLDAPVPFNWSTVSKNGYMTAA